MIYWIVFLPLAGFLYCGFFGNRFEDKYSQIITCFFLTISSILSWIIFFKFLGNAETQKFHLLNWITSGDFLVNWSFRLDSLTAVMLVVVTTMSACIHVYSIGYMSEDNSIPRFMGYLSLFTFFMLTLVTSDNLLQMYFGWEGVGLASYLLIGFWHHKESANKAAIKAFIVNRVGDFGYTLGIVGVFFIFGSVYFDTIFSQVTNHIDHTIHFFSFDFSTINILCFLLFIGAMGKSAQLGFHTWLPDAMEGPTPVSALIHAATMVTAGVFMVARMSPLFEYADITNIFVTFIGASTAIFAATIAITQNDIKRVIAYSTCSQLGYMFFAAGLGAYNAAIFHLMTHGFFKALLFLSAGSVIHALHHEQDMRKMGGLFKKMPQTTTLMWIGSLAIIGFPLFSGYYSKESILEAAYFANSNIGKYAYIVGIVTALLTAFYSWRLLFMTFHGNSRIPHEIWNSIHESPKVMTIPLFILAAGSIFSGLFFVDIFLGLEKDFFWRGSIVIHHDKHIQIPFIQTLIIKFSVASGIVLAAIIYFYKTELAKILTSYLNPLYKISLNKWYVDELYSKIFIRPTFLLATFLWEKGDQKSIDAYGPDGVSRLINILSRIASRVQSGFLYHYVFIMFGGLVVILSWFVYKNHA